jgi:serine/threonine-protein kinase
MSWPYAVGSVVHAGADGDIYRLVRCLGESPSAVVYHAEDLRGRCPEVALKLLRRDLATTAVRREWRTLAALRHPNIVRLLSFGTTRDGHRIPYLAMPLLRGASLRDTLAYSGTLGLWRSVEHAIELADALTEAHRRKIVHRDLRPENLFLTRPEPRIQVLVVLDFGLACFAGVRSQLTQALVGHPRYAAPELFEDARPSPAADVFAAGLVLREMLTGSAIPAPLELRGAPPPLVSLIASVVAESAKQRPSAPQLAQALREIQRALPVNANTTEEDPIDSVLRQIAGPDSDEVTQDHPPPSSLLRHAGLAEDDTDVDPPSSKAG